MVEEKKKLGLTGSKLGLSDKISGKLGIPAVGGTAKAPSAGPSNKKGTIVVVKSRAAMRRSKEAEKAPADYRLSQDERAQRMEALHKAEDIMRARRRIEPTRAPQPEPIPVVEATSEIEEVALEHAALEPILNEPLPSANDVLGAHKGRSKIKNLDLLFRPPSKKVEEERKNDTEEVEAVPILADLSTLEEARNTATKLKKKIREDLPEVEEKNKTAFDKKKGGKLSVTQLMMEEEGTRRRSLASIRRARDKVRRQNQHMLPPKEKIVREVMLPDVISVQELSNRMAEKSTDVIRTLMKLGMMVTINQAIDADTAEIVVSEFGHKVKRVTAADIESSFINSIEDSEEQLQPRAPVVTVMGHVDHGKTSLLDALRKTDVVKGEAGGITQHIGAYKVTLKSGEEITFLDTPGHEAFTAMRSRGAKVTDIVVLVVAADDGIMAQTIEAISHAKAAGVPVIVAVNKMDKPSANPQRVRTELLSYNLVPEEMGGDTIVVELSAKTGMNLDKLQEAILLQAEVLDLKANPERAATGVVLEAKIDKGRGPVATFLVQRGTLRRGDIVVAGQASGKVRAIVDDKGDSLDEAGPSTPVEILGLDTAPTAGDDFMVARNERNARELVSFRVQLEKERKLLASNRVSLDQLFKEAGEGQKKDLAVLIKSDVQGSAEAIATSLQKLSNDEVEVKVLYSAVGAITESDVALANASSAIILGFNVRANNQARDIAKREGVEIRYFSVIYEMIDEVKAALSGLLSPTIKEEITGYADVREVFNLSKYGKIAGCYMTEGSGKRSAKVRIIRDGIVVLADSIKALKRFKEDVREVKAGFEFGMSLDRQNDFQVGDKLEFYEVTEHKRTL
jgi:translation initiation factor IF-2